MKHLSFLILLAWTSSWSQFEIKQNSSDDIEFGLACIETATSIHFDTSVYRSFDWDIDIPFNGAAFVNTAYFAIEGITESIEITITLYAALGDFPDGTLEMRGTTTYNATPGDAFSLIAVPIDANFEPFSDDSIVYELAVSGNGTASFLFGANSQGQSGPSYIRAEDCSINEPTELVELGNFGSIIMYLEANGEFIGFEDETVNNFKIYPNPAQNKLNFSGESQIELIKVYDLSGRLLIEKSIYSNHFTLDTSKLNTGEYIATIFSEQKQEHLKFLKL